MMAGGARGWQDRGVPGRPAAFDELDERIVAVLVEDARASYADIGVTVGLSASAVKRRVEPAPGVRGHHRVHRDRQPLGPGLDHRGVCGTVLPRPDLPQRHRRRAEQISRGDRGLHDHPGEADALLHIRAADVQHFEQVVERIVAEPFVDRTRSVIVLSRLVSRADSLPASNPGG